MIHPTPIRILTFAAAAFLLADGARAATLSGGYHVSAVHSSCSAQGTGSGTITESGCDYLLSGGFTVSASGDATYDTLRATARAGFSGVRENHYTGFGSRIANAIGSARYEDRITIDVDGRTGETVDLVFTTALNGTMQTSGNSNTLATASAGLSAWVNGEFMSVTRAVNSSAAGSTGNDFNPGRVQITLGVPFLVVAELKVAAELLALTTNALDYTGEAVSDFGNSGGITSFELFELGGAPIADYRLSSESGQFGLYMVPEPGTGWLLATLLTALGACRYRGRSALSMRARA